MNEKEEKDISEAMKIGLILQLPTGTYSGACNNIE